MSLAERIRRRREHLGMTQQEVARPLSISREAVQQWENGKTAPRGKRLRALSDLLQCSVQWLMTDDAEIRERLSGADMLSAVFESLPERDRLIVMDLAESLARRQATPNNGPVASAPPQRKKGQR